MKLNGHQLMSKTKERVKEGVLPKIKNQCIIPLHSYHGEVQ